VKYADHEEVITAGEAEDTRPLKTIRDAHLRP
jgi:hypothetical protein